MEKHKCEICGRYKTGGASKKIADNVYICSKGMCRYLYNCNEEMIDRYGLKMVLDVCKGDYEWAKRKEVI